MGQVWVGALTVGYREVYTSFGEKLVATAKNFDGKPYQAKQDELPLRGQRDERNNPHCHLVSHALFASEKGDGGAPPVDPLIEEDARTPFGPNPSGLETQGLNGRVLARKRMVPTTISTTATMPIPVVCNWSIPVRASSEPLAPATVLAEELVLVSELFVRE